MSLTMDSVFNCTLRATWIKDTEAVINATHLLEVAERRAYGTAATQLNLIYSDLSLTLAGAATTLDLQALTDVSGAAIDFAKIYRIGIINTTATNGFDLTVGGAVANPWEPFVSATGDKIVIPDGSDWFWSDVDGATVDATHSDLKLDPGANTLVAKLLIIGLSA